ncbi:hypothetical protein A3K86_16885 [Photobacterium jeanii]|uniref:DUF4427 domain-containing protein n=2 Tax=Vibrionaceae TaxID=641 RepID=A0A178K881_9GAMM|nr:DUF4427 domain-containing protein [Photobacterium jeanii]OAN13327.1 hypothetical protein A3K86_16885 [Photobacterium jeanii]PST90326.1 cytoplasmic protein [Photobacterium jeanii]
MKNNVRFDLSNYLIHFYRDVDLLSDDAIAFPEHMGFDNICYETNLDALFLLRCSIRKGRIWASWSYRNGKPTIYGYNPAVCFTDMPVAAFFQTSFERKARGEKISQHALCIPKPQGFAYGARPVIYALTDSNVTVTTSHCGQIRVIDTNKLPLSEQYRYVAYDPCRPIPLDWSHEREWRWSYKGDLSQYFSELEDGVLEDERFIPALNLNVNSFNGLGVIVENSKEAKMILHDIIRLVDQKIIPLGFYEFILVSEALSDISKIINPAGLNSEIAKAQIDLSPYFVSRQKDADYLNNQIGKIANTVRENSKGTPSEVFEYGTAWVWVLDNTSNLARLLIQTDRMIVSQEGRYLIKLPEFEVDCSLSDKEKMCEEVAQLLSAEYGVECVYYSVTSSSNENSVPFYAGDHDGNLFYNRSY